MAAAHTGMCHRADEQELLYVNLERFTYNAENVSDYVFFPNKLELKINKKYE